MRKKLQSHIEMAISPNFGIIFPISGTTLPAAKLGHCVGTMRDRGKEGADTEGQVPNVLFGDYGFLLASWRLTLACNDALSGTLRTSNGCDGGHHRRMRQTRLVGKNHNKNDLNVGLALVPHVIVFVHSHGQRRLQRVGYTSVKRNGVINKAKRSSYGVLSLSRFRREENRGANAEKKCRERSVLMRL